MTTILTKEQATIERLLPDIRATHKEFLKSGQATVELARQIGDMLWKLKECVKHGEWVKLVEDRCEFEIRTAQTYMKVAGGWDLLEKKEAAATTIDGAVKLIGQASPKKGGKAHSSRKAPKAGKAKSNGKPPSQSDAPAEPPPESFDPDEIEAQDDTLDLAAKQAPYDEMLNALTSISRLWGQVVSDERDGVYAMDKRQRVELLIRDLRGPIAQARPHAVCSECGGKGCRKCQNCGWWPRSVVEGLKK